MQNCNNINLLQIQLGGTVVKYFLLLYPWANFVRNNENIAQVQML